MKKILIVLLSILLLASCGTANNNSDSTDLPSIPEVSEESEAGHYLNLLYNYEVKDKNPENTVNNEEFEDYLNQIFLDILGEDYLYMHYNISDYEALGVEKPEVSWGEVNYDASTDIEEYIEELEELRSFDYDSLSYREQYYYDMYEYSLLETILSLYFSHYGTLFSEGNDTLNNIVVNLDEFKLSDKEYVEDYLILLADTDRYIDDLLTYTEKQMEDGIYHSDDSIDYSVNYAESFISKVEDNALISSFDTKLENADYLSEEEKNSYSEKNAQIVKEEIIPAFEKVSDFLDENRGKLDEDKEKLCDIDMDYAKATYLLNTSSNKDINTLFNEAEEEMEILRNALEAAISDEDAVNEYYALYDGNNKTGFGLSDEETLEYLKEHIGNRYPEMEDISYTVSRLDATSAADSTIAYFVSPQLDALDQNVIRTNPNAMGQDVVDDYITLAHEGIPGHMYQNAYYQATNPNRFTSTQSFIGYTEGYACYAMIDALSFSGIENENTRTIVTFFEIFDYIIMSLCDIGVNVYGWDADDVQDYLEEHYPYEIYESAGEMIYSSSITRPGTLVSYGIGYVQFVKLRRNAKEELGSKFDYVEYNETILDEGELPLVILEDKVNDYINEKMGK